MRASSDSLGGVCGAMDRPGFTASLVAGGVAGVAVDLILFPLDTIKTRLQSPQGFNKAGGFRGIYAGVPSAAIGSFPNAAAFFITYEYVKWLWHTDSSSYLMPVKHMLAASAGEVVACLIRVPSEVVKQRAQVSASSRTFQIFSNILYTEGIQGLYRGYKSTVLREIPFSLVQFPLWESLKALWSWRQDHVVDCWQSAVCGAFAGLSCLPATPHMPGLSSLTWPQRQWWICSCSHHTSGCGENKNHVGKGKRPTTSCRHSRRLYVVALGLVCISRESKRRDPDCRGGLSGLLHSASHGCG
ncbi:mitochondrial S-adenosylmethionine carrier protein isoform X1 [Mirounga angustirostris]|uniref:mitochondrial S-adenosylmethionine carrier protein isoform X1 n=1 Tax=Mirounga angustirostris TaxID=9716 RepID=UPI00313C9C99